MTAAGVLLLRSTLKPLLGTRCLERLLVPLPPRSLFFHRHYGDWSCELVALIHMPLWIPDPVMRCLAK